MNFFTAFYIYIFFNLFVIFSFPPKKKRAEFYNTPNRNFLSTCLEHAETCKIKLANIFALTMIFTCSVLWVQQGPTEQIKICKLRIIWIGYHAWSSDICPKFGDLELRTKHRVCEWIVSMLRNKSPFENGRSIYNS